MKFAVERPVATTMSLLALAIIGFYSFLHIPIELAPQEEYPQISLRTSWPDVPPDIIQAEITSPLEEAAATIRGVRRITSTSSVGLSLITLEFDPKTNMELARLLLRERISRLRPKLPLRATWPEIVPYVPEDFRTEPYLQMTIAGPYSVQELYDLVREKLEYGLESIKGVATVEVSGGAQQEILISLDREKLFTLNLTPFHLLKALQAWPRTLSAGLIKRGEKEFLFRLAAGAENLAQLENIPVAKINGITLHLKDVARISYAYSPIRTYNRINGLPTVSLTVHKEKGTNTLKVDREVKKKLVEIKKDLPANLIFRPIYDEAEEISKNLKELIILAILILILIFLLTLIILRRLLPCFLVLSSVIFSVLITFIPIYIFKLSLNMLTLGALALGFGLFVDNAVVVFENILRRHEQGYEAKEAALKGPPEVFSAVLASTLTTIAVFICFPYFQGRLKIYYWPLAIIISSALAVSLFVSFSLIPALSPKLLTKRRKLKKQPIRQFYARFLSLIINHPIEIIIMISLLVWGSYRYFSQKVTLGEFFSWIARDRLIVSVTMPPGTDLAQTDEVIRKFEAKVLAKDYAFEMNSRVTAEKAYIIITFPPEIEHSWRPYALKEELIQLATNFAGLGISVYGFDPQGYYSSFGPGTLYGSWIKFYGYNLKKLRDLAADLEKRLRQNPRIKETKIISSERGWWTADTYEHILKINREVLYRYQINPEILLFHLQSLLRGEFQAPLRWRLDGKELTVSLRFPEADRIDLKALLDTLISSERGEHFRLNDLVAVEERPISGSIDRDRQRFQVTVLWEYRGPSRAAERFQKEIFNSLILPPGFTATMEFPWQMTIEEKGQIKMAVVAALAVILMILASLFESFRDAFVAILIVPLSLIGVFFAFVIANFPFDSSAYIGLILLFGIVVNNSILLVNHIRLKRDLGKPLKEAVIEGTIDRIRPIFLTTGTTIFGLLPLILIQTEIARRRLWSSLALATLGGLTSSTLFIFFTIPVFYYYAHYFCLRLGQKKDLFIGDQEQKQRR
ncbi:MAG: efflux RND transporter permease subunit [Candidatus Aminicenantes bacterium]|nr:efflux RND transporter permease subunit [Candidatus Aminicenantes bacterium]